MQSHVDWLVIQKNESISTRDVLLQDLEVLEERVDAAMAAHAEVHTEEHTIGLSVSDYRKDELRMLNQDLHV